MKSLYVLKKETFIIILSAIWLSLPTLSFALPNSDFTHTEQGIAYPKPNYGISTQRALIEKGEYLAKAGDCIACHTDTQHNGTPFAGGLGIKTSVGTLYTPNITPDKDTGIGNWTDEQFLKAMQQGIKPNGSYYFPAFPYPYFTKINRTDLLAIKAYLFSLKPIHQTVPANAPLFRWHFLALGWRFLFFHSGEYRYEPHQSAEWNRGAYLVQGPGHCGMCHTPINFMGAAKEEYFLKGSIVDHYYAPAITSDALKNYTVEQIAAVFAKDKLLTGGPVKGPMAEVNNNSLKYMSPDDLRAIASYLKTVKSKLAPRKPNKLGSDTGKKIYTSYCATCHNTGAAGAPKIGDTAAWIPRSKQGTNIILQHTINGIGSMPPKGNCVSCSDQEIQATVEYMLEHSITTQ